MARGNKRPKIKKRTKITLKHRYGKLELSLIEVSPLDQFQADFAHLFVKKIPKCDVMEKGIEQKVRKLILFH